MDSRVTVKIYGQEFTIAGDKSEEEIIRIAEYVDNKMRLISRVAGDAGQGSIGILSAVNIAEEYFEAVKEAEQLRIARQQMENDSKYYLKMWEDAKKNFAQYKESIADMKTRRKKAMNASRNCSPDAPSTRIPFSIYRWRIFSLKANLKN